MRELTQSSANEDWKTVDKHPSVSASGGMILSMPHMVSTKIPAQLAHSGHLLICAPFITFLLSLSPSPWPHLCFLRLLPVLVLCLGESTCQCRRRKRCKFNFWVRKIPWSRKCNPLQYSCLGNSKDTGTCWATVLGITKESDMTW